MPSLSRVVAPPVRTAAPVSRRQREGRCVSGGLGRVQLQTPQWASRVRIVATVALDARTTPGDAGALGMTYELLSFDEPRRLKPHAWNIESSSLRR